jgi:hypothetical protein
MPSCSKSIAIAIANHPELCTMIHLVILPLAAYATSTDNLNLTEKAVIDFIAASLIFSVLPIDVYAQDNATESEKNAYAKVNESLGTHRTVLGGVLVLLGCSGFLMALSRAMSSRSDGDRMTLTLGLNLFYASMVHCGLYVAHRITFPRRPNAANRLGQALLAEL